MSGQTIPLTGGESVYCINESQLAEAMRLANDDPESAKKIQAVIGKLENEMTRNEMAAIAFVLIDRLLNTTNK